jgi:hypothetical protein
VFRKPEDKVVDQDDDLASVPTQRGSGFRSATFHLSQHLGSRYPSHASPLKIVWFIHLRQPCENFSLIHKA